MSNSTGKKRPAASDASGEGMPMPMDVDRDSAAALAAADGVDAEENSSVAMMKTETAEQISSSRDWSTFMQDELDAGKKKRIINMLQKAYDTLVEKKELQWNGRNRDSKVSALVVAAALSSSGDAVTDDLAMAALAVFEPEVETGINFSHTVLMENRLRAKENFESKYVNATPKKQTDELQEYILACYKEYKKSSDRYYSPYIALCQSSGWGKSRLIQQLALRMRVVYFSFMKDTSSGYPTRVGADYLLGASSSEDALASQIEEAVNLSMQLPPFDFEVHGENFWKVLLRKLDLDSFKSQITTVQVQTQADVQMKADDPMTNSAEPQPVVLVFDESRELIDNRVFMTLRRALITLAQKKDVFGVFCDTTMRIANYVPPKTAKSSERAKVGLLFHPFLLTGNNDILTQDDDFQVSWKRKDYIRYLGRPLWRGTTRDIALQKLTRNHAEEKSDLAVMFSRLGIFLQPTCELAEVLSSNHLATLIAVNSDRTHFLVTYISEPFLSNAAAFKWADLTFLCKGIQKLNNAFLQGHVLEGSRGETVGCIVLLRAIDALAEHSEIDEWRNLGEFLELFAKDKSKDAKDESNDILDANLRDAKILFTHFVPWYRDLREEDIELLVRRRAGCIAQRNQDGVDLILPFWKDKSYTEDGATTTTTEYGMIWVQIKNCVQHQDMAKVGYKMHDDYVFPDLDIGNFLGVVRIAMELGLERRDPRGGQARKPEIVSISTKTAGEKTVVTASSAKRPLTIDRSLRSSDYSFLRIKGIKSIAFLDDNLQRELLLLLDGPMRPSVWWKRNKPRNIGEDGHLPGHDIHFDTLCFDFEDNDY